MITVGLYGIQDTDPGPNPRFTHDHNLALMRDGHDRLPLPPRAHRRAT